MVKNVFKLLLLSIAVLVVSSCSDDPLVASINASKEVVKAGETYTLSVATSGGDGSSLSYYWQENGGGYGVAESSSEDFSQTAPGQYTHMVMVQSSSEQTTAQITITVEQGTAPTISISNSKTTVRVNESYTLTANGGVSNSTYSWNDGSTSKSVTYTAPSTAKTVNHSVTVTTPGTATVTKSISVDVKSAGAVEPYHLHSNIMASTFWAGEGKSADNHDISNVPSAWDNTWGDKFGVEDWPGLNRDSDFIPTDNRYGSTENPYYFALPYNDFSTLVADMDDNQYGHVLQNVANLNSAYSYEPSPYDASRNVVVYSSMITYGGTQRKPSIQQIPWKAEFSSSSNGGRSIVKGRWIRVRFNGGAWVYAQWMDAGPYHYDDYEYIFGTARPRNEQGANTAVGPWAGIDLSPSVWLKMGKQTWELGNSGLNDYVDWQFVDYADVPSGPWKKHESDNLTNW